jgi:hypothetical protein
MVTAFGTNTCHLDCEAEFPDLIQRQFFYSGLSLEISTEIRKSIEYQTLMPSPRPPFGPKPRPVLRPNTLRPFASRVLLPGRPREAKLNPEAQRKRTTGRRALRALLAVFADVDRSQSVLARRRFRRHTAKPQFIARRRQMPLTRALDCQLQSTEMRPALSRNN